MNDLPATQAPHSEPSPPTIAKATMTAGGALAALVPQTLDDAFRLSKALSLSGDMVPKHFQGKPEMIMAAVLRGAEIGLAPMQALSNIAVINGRASIWGDALPALLQRGGHDIDSGIEGDGDQMVAWAEVKRGDTGKVIRRTFSVADAKKASLWGKQGPWQSYPQRMLQMRARAFAARDGAADALMGLQVAEEMRDAPLMRDVTPHDKPHGNLAQRIAAAPAHQDRPATGPEFAQDGEVEEIRADAHEDEVASVEEEMSGQGFPGSKQWNEGEQAFINDKPLNACPYDQAKQKQEAADWIGGWVRMKKVASE